MRDRSTWMAGASSIPVLVGLLSLVATLAAAEGSQGDEPDGPRLARSGGAERPIPVEVPFRRVKDQRLIDVHINGRGPFTFLVDTGVSGVAIESGLARELGIELDEEKAQKIGGGPDAGRFVYQTRIPHLAVGRLEVERLQAAALPLGRFGERLGERLDGILGGGFLATRVTRFDDVEQMMAFAPSLDAFAADLAAADFVTPIVTNPGEDMPLLEVSMHGKTFTATLDTGSSLGLEIFRPFAKELGLGHALTEWPPSGVFGGSLGEAIAYDGTLDRIDIGPLVFRDVPASITPPRSDPNRKGNIGNQLWRGCVLILDFVDRRLVVRRKGEA